MIRNALRHIALIGALWAAPAILGAGANTWTGGRPPGAAEGAPALVAADPASPDVVYGAFGPLLYRSSDGGRTWRHLRSFTEVRAVLVHPASPSTIYVAADDVFKSTDGGETWSATSIGYVESLAGSPTDVSTVYAGAWDAIFKTTDAGATWSSVDYIGLISSLVIDARDPTIVYAGAEGVEYFGDYPGSLGKSTDSGASWLTSRPEALDSVVAIGLDAVASSTVYIATGGYRWGGGSNIAPDVLRSDDGGVSWTSIRAGLPGGRARSLAVDPRVAGTVYAGTEEGVYRSRNGGRSWTPFSQSLAGVPITSLAIADSGRRLHAGTTNGAYELEIARGPIDVSAGLAGGSRILVWDGDRMALGELDVSGHWTSTPPGDASATWTSIAIASTGGERTHVLWQNGDGRTSLEILGPSGSQVATVFEKRSGWIATDVSVGPDGQTHVLWSGADGRMSIARVSSSGATTDGPEYGPAPGWSAVAIADGPGGDTWVLWRSTDGRFVLSLHHDGTLASSLKFGAHLDWAAEDVAVGADGRMRLLRTNPSGLASIVTVDAAGQLSAGRRYTLPGFTPRRIATGADGRTRLLFDSEDGQGELLLLNPDNTMSARHALYPLASIFVTTTSELEAALAPTNAGKHILVRAGEYEIGQALTVPDRATLVGEGNMHFDELGQPAGFAPSGRTLLRSTPDLVGDVLTLGDGATLRGLVIEDAAGRQGGNPVVVTSRVPGDFISASLARCEIINPNPAGIVPAGPTGAALVAITRNPNLGQDPPPHDGAFLFVSMRDSIVRSPGGGTGVFAINFASHARVSLVVERNVIGGGLISTGGVSRPEAVTGSRVSIESRRNLYWNESLLAGTLGWNLIGGAGSPVFPSAASTLNRLHVDSENDSIHGFQLGISAIGGQRFLAASEASSSNRVDLDLQGLRVQTMTEASAADLVLFGARSFVNGASPGDDNLVRVRMAESSGSGPRDNQYADSWSPSMGDLGAGNRLEVDGDADEFVRTNDGFDPMPPPEFFTEQQ